MLFIEEHNRVFHTETSKRNNMPTKTVENDPRSSMENDMSEKWDRRFMDMAGLVAGWSKDPSTKIGVVLVSNRKVVSTGYNGFPVGIADNERLDDREQKYPLVIHAEMNAILQAGKDAEGSTLYLHGFPGPPCRNCTKHVIQAGIVRIVHPASGEVPERWLDELNNARVTLQEAGIDIDSV